MPFPITDDAEDKARANATERIWNVYALERGADQAMPPVSFALATVGITYMAATVALLVNAGAVSLPLTLLIPLAPVGFYTALVGLDAASQERARYLDELEEFLQTAHEGEGIGPSAPAWRKRSKGIFYRSGIWGLLAAVTHPYIQSALYVVAFSSYVLFRLDQHEQPENVVAWTAYVVAMSLNILRLLRSREVTAKVIAATVRSSAH